MSLRENSSGKHKGQTTISKRGRSKLRVVLFNAAIPLIATNPECPVGRNIHLLLDDKLKSIQEAMESEMKKYTLNDLRSGMQELLAKEA